MLLPPSPSLHQCFVLRVFKATQKGKKSKQGFVVTPRNQTWDLNHTEGCAPTNRANLPFLKSTGLHNTCTLQLDNNFIKLSWIVLYPTLG